MSKIYIITKNWSRHGKYSGYEKLIDYYKINLIIFKIRFNLPYRFSNFIKIKTKLINYRSETILKELVILFKFFTKKNVHILYGDMDFFFLQYIKRIPFNFRKNNLIATFHHPPYELEKRLGYDRRKVLSTLDKIIVMGPNQIPFFRKYTDAEIKFIPHGIDINYFKPSNSIKRKNQIFIIGVSHRNTKRDIQIIEALNNSKSNIEFKIIVPKGFEKIYRNIPNTEIITEKISDSELLYFYQNSKGVLLSLIDCTASNTILEALSTGCPLFINNVGAVKDYIPENSGVPVFENGSIDSQVAYIRRIVLDESFLNDISKKQRVLAQEYSWDKIAALTKDFILN